MVSLTAIPLLSVAVKMATYGRVIKGLSEMSGFSFCCVTFFVRCGSVFVQFRAEVTFGHNKQKKEVVYPLEKDTRQLLLYF